MADFKERNKPTSLGAVKPTYPIGVEPISPEEYLPEFITDSLRESIRDFDEWLPGFDFGDAIRVAGSTVDEDEKGLSKVALDLQKYEAFTRGFVGMVKDGITEAERSTLALGVVAMTVECGVRFLTDYLNGDKYFRIHYPDQNLARAKCHLTLTLDMIAKLDQMQAIVEKYCK